MQVIDQDTGENIILDLTPELLADLTLLNEKCGHSRQELRQKRNRGGTLQYAHQCLDCGLTVGSFLKHSPELENVPKWDEQIIDVYDAARITHRNVIYQKHARIQRKRTEGFWKVYNAYLKTKEWREKRERVLQRANGQCEGCGIRRATQVHHLTYDHLRKEFLFELVAICDDCHKRLHDRQQEQLHQEDFEYPESTGPCGGCRYESDENGKPWCHLSDISAEAALSANGNCGPNRSLFEPLR
jgi:5-methylcytosine-specific restriction endonuclease McrA